ncbi:MAG: MSMEG_6728 family protein [Alphaproteobacteria bacterium]
MQTFLPYPDFEESMRVLDYRRLGKQRLEAKQLLRAIAGEGGWVNHPATRMWRDYAPALALYHDEAIREWKRRGYRNTMPLLKPKKSTIVLPHWLGDKPFHRSHQSNLVRKDADYYRKYFPNVPADLPYVWPK